MNEAFLRLFAGADDERAPAWNDRRHFFALAAKVMRQVLVDHARRQGRRKRGGDQLRVTLDERLAVTDAPAPEVELLDLDEALAELGALDERQGRIVELRFFGGLGAAEVSAEQLIGALSGARSLVSQDRCHLAGRFRWRPVGHVSHGPGTGAVAWRRAALTTGHGGLQRGVGRRMDDAAMRTPDSSGPAPPRSALQCAMESCEDSALPAAALTA